MAMCSDTMVGQAYTSRNWSRNCDVTTISASSQVLGKTFGMVPLCPSSDYGCFCVTKRRELLQRDAMVGQVDKSRNETRKPPTTHTQAINVSPPTQALSLIHI